MNARSTCPTQEVVIFVNYWVSVLFRAIPLMMMALCLGFGIYVWTAADDPANFVAGRVVTFLGAICLCLFCTAATIIRQLIGRFNETDRILYTRRRSEPPRTASHSSSEHRVRGRARTMWRVTWCSDSD